MTFSSPSELYAQPIMFILFIYGILKGAITMADYVALNCKKINESLIGKGAGGIGYAYFKGLSQHLTEKTEGNNEKRHSGQSLSRSRFEPNSSRIKVRSVSAWTKLHGNTLHPLPSFCYPDKNRLPLKSRSLCYV
jgi:hypothetical protein